MIKKLFILLIVLFSYNIDVKAQDTCFTKTEILNIYNNIKELQETDSLRIVLISELKYQNTQYKVLNLQDSTIQVYQQEEIDLLKNRINLYKDLVKETKPKWYQTKFVGFIEGAATILVASWVVSNTK